MRKHFTIGNLVLKGPSIEGILPFSALPKLYNFQTIIKTLGNYYYHKEIKKDDTDYKPMLNLAISAIKKGSASLDVCEIIEPQSPLLIKDKSYASRAFSSTIEAINSANSKRNVTYGFPREALLQLRQFSIDISKDIYTIDLNSNGNSAQVTDTTRRILSELVDKPYHADVELTGKVIEINGRNYSFILKPDYYRRVEVSFNRENEAFIIGAFEDRADVNVNLKGKGLFDSYGKLKKVIEVETINKYEELTLFNYNKNKLWDVAKQLSISIKQKGIILPDDFSSNHDKYIYGEDNG